MASITIVLRPSTRRGMHPGSLSLRVIKDRKVKTSATGCHLYSYEWDAEKQAIIYPDNDPLRTAYLEETETKLAACRETAESLIAALERQGLYTAGDVTGKLRRKKDDGKLLGYAETLAVELECGGQFRLAAACRTVSAALVKFNKNTDIPLGSINAALLKGFEADLMNRGRKPNTISYYMRNLRSIYNKAVAARRITAKAGNPFTGVNTKVHPAAKRALTAEETTRFYEVDFDALRQQHPADTPERQHIENLYFSRRLFMFCFFAQGMSFIDMA